MYRFVRQAVTAATTVLVAVAIPSSAQAANGLMTLNGSQYANPVGCFTPSDNPYDTLDIDNHTDQTLAVYHSADCSGDPASSALPGYFGSYSGDSVYAP